MGGELAVDEIVGRAVPEAVDDASEPDFSAFDRVKAFIAGHIGAVRLVQAEQQSAGELLEQAEDELGELKRAFERARLGSPTKAE